MMLAAAADIALGRFSGDKQVRNTKVPAQVEQIDMRSPESWQTILEWAKDYATTLVQPNALEPGVERVELEVAGPDNSQNHFVTLKLSREGVQLLVNGAERPTPKADKALGDFITMNQEGIQHIRVNQWFAPLPVSTKEFAGTSLAQARLPEYLSQGRLKFMTLMAPGTRDTVDRRLPAFREEDMFAYFSDSDKSGMQSRIMAVTRWKGGNLNPDLYGKSGNTYTYELTNGVPAQEVTSKEQQPPDVEAIYRQSVALRQNNRSAMGLFDIRPRPRNHR
jgi:hypothetical protein